MKTTIALLSCALLLLQLISCSSSTEQKKKEHAGLFPIRDNGKYGYIDASGKIVITPQFLQAYEFSEDLARVNVGGRVGFIDKTGKIIITPQFDDAGVFSEGFAFVTIGEKVGVIDKTGKMVITPQFDKITTSNYFFVDGIAPARVGDKIGYIDTVGKFVVNPQFDIGQGFSEGLAVVGIGERDNRDIRKCGYIDKTGKFVINPQFVQCQDFQGGLAVVGQGTYNSWRTVVIDKTGEVAFRADTFFPRGNFIEGLSVACRKDVGINAECGYIDKLGNWIIQRQFAQAYPFSEGLAAVTFADEAKQQFTGTGYIDKTGKLVISPQFAMGAYDAPFSGGLAQVSIQGKMAYIDRTGKIVWQEKP